MKLSPTRTSENIMKILKSCIMIIAVLCYIISLTSCDKTEGSISFSGKVEVSPSLVKVGDEVTFSIDQSKSLGGITINNESSIIINGKEVVKSVVYYIDGTEIAESTDKENGYVATYVVSGFTVGTYSVTAHCKSNFKDVEINESISFGILTIEE